MQSNRTEDDSDKLAMYLENNIDKYEGFKISNLQKKFSPDLSYYDVKEVCKERGFKAGSSSIDKIQMRVWTRGDHKKVIELHKVNSF